MSSIRRKAEGVWIVRFLDGGKPPVGRHRQVTVRGSHADAKRELERLLGKRALRPRGSAPSRLTFKALVVRYLEAKKGRVSKAWLAYADRVLNMIFVPRFGARRVEDLQAADVVLYQHQRIGDKVTGATVNRESDVLMGALNFAEKFGWIERNPIPRSRLTRHKERRRDRIFSEAEWGSFMTAFDDAQRWEEHSRKVRRLGPMTTDLTTGKARRHGGAMRPDSKASHGYRGRLRLAMSVFKALMLTGSRRGEILSLKWGQIDRKRATVTILLSKTKNRGLAKKTLPLVSGLKDLIESLPAGIGEALVFQKPGGGPWEERKLLHHFKLAVMIAGIQDPGRVDPIERLTPHSIRHTVETWLVRADFSEAKRNAFLGHADDSMAARYTHLEPEDLIPLVEHLSKKAGLSPEPEEVAREVARENE